MDNEYIERFFTYHDPIGIDPQRFISIRNKAKELAIVILENGGLYEEKYSAIQSLRQCVYHAVASIAIPEKKV